MVDGSSPLAVAAYGSKVAGYARADSDYDLIVVAKKLRGGIRYHYLDSPVEVSALLVEESLLQRDASKAYLGEFVSGRLLNVYEPLLNGDLFREAEVESKKRVIVEEALEASSQYAEFAQDLVVPLDYFLFEKLHKRALIYPPALYSYVKTYTCPSGEENRRASLEGFAEAAKLLERAGALRLDEGDRVRILGEGLRGRAFARELALLNLTTRGVRQYAVHGYAGRVGFKVFKDEALSKMRRMREKADPPRELVEPKGLLGLEEGFAVAKTEQLAERLAKLQLRGPYTKRERGLGEIYTTARLVTLRGKEGSESGGKEFRFVFKHFADVRSVKWALLNAWTPSRGFSMSPYARMHREYAASLALSARGIAVPRVLGVALDDRVMAKEFVEGERLSDIVQSALTGSEDLGPVEGYGEAVGEVHAAGFALGDSKANNIVVVRGGEEEGGRAKMYFTDLEQALEGGDQAWDVAEFLYYPAKLSFKEAGARRVARAFLEGYRRVNGRETIGRARSQKYVAPFKPLTPANVLNAIRESIEEYSRAA